MENQANSKSIILNYGLYLGILGVIIHLIFWASGSLFELQRLHTITGTVFIVVFIVLGIKKFKADNGGFASWGQGVKIGMGIVMLNALIGVVYTLLFTSVIHPGYQTEVMVLQEQEWLNSGLSSEQIETSIEMAEKFQGPVVSSAIILASSALIGFIISAIIAAVMKRTEENPH